MEYRREIDGLRAIAVLPVMLFHAGFETFSGGFVGVDVFFVISGYLITSIIAAELEKGTFSIANFYERRARRILPVLLLVQLTCLPFAWLWLLPSDMKDFSQSLVAVATFASNVLFWHKSGYFDAAAEFRPLLHTWSLALEEQFYVLFPLVLVAFRSVGRRATLAAMGLLCAISLGLAQRGAYTDPTASFYLLPTRGWELLLGALAAFCSQAVHRGQLSKASCEAGGWTGLALIVFAMFSYGKTTPYPGLYALAPTVGAVLIILLATEKTTLAKFMGNKVLVGLGLMSYSAYLWHQPVFAFARHRSLTEPDQSTFIALMCLTFVLAFLSWRFIETPARNRQTFSRQALITTGLVLTLVLVAFGLMGHRTSGYPSRFPDVVAGIENPPDNNPSICKKSGDQKFCILGHASATATMAMLGDSHSYKLGEELSKQLGTLKKSMHLYDGSWCAPLMDFGTSHPSKRPECRQYMEDAFKQVIENKDIATVILVAEWSNYTTGQRWGDDGVAFYTDSFSKETSHPENIATVERAFNRTISALQAANKTIVIVKSTPEYSAMVPKYLAKNYLYNGELNMGQYTVNASTYAQRNMAIERIFQKLNHPDIQFTDTFSIFCPTSVCEVANERGAFYSDSNHLSLLGSARLVPFIIRSAEATSATSGR